MLSNCCFTPDRGTGGTAVVHVSHHCDQGLIPAPCSYLIEVTLVTCEKYVVQFDSTKNHRFSPGTSVSSSRNTEPMRENSLAA